MLFAFASMQSSPINGSTVYIVIILKTMGRVKHGQSFTGWLGRHSFIFFDDIFGVSWSCTEDTSFMVQVDVACCNEGNTFLRYQTSTVVLRGRNHGETIKTH